MIVCMEQVRKDSQQTLFRAFFCSTGVGLEYFGRELNYSAFFPLQHLKLGSF